MPFNLSIIWRLNVTSKFFTSITLSKVLKDSQTLENPIQCISTYYLQSLGGVKSQEQA